MYKTVFIEHIHGGYSMQRGKMDKLNQVIQQEAEQGYELLTMTIAPYPINAARVGYILVFKKIK